MKKIFLGILLLTVHYLHAQQKMNLLQCIDYAWQHNISVIKQQNQAEISALSLEQVKQSQYPTANFSTNGGMQFGRSVNPITNQFTTSQLLFQGLNFNTNATIFNWNSVKNNAIASLYNLQAEQAMVDKLKNDIGLNVATDYLSALLYKAQVTTARIQYEQTKSQLDLTRKKVNVGILPELNAAEMEAQLTRDSANIINIKASAEIALLQLKNQMNMDAALPLDIEEPDVVKIPLENLLNLQPETVYQAALQNQPDQKINQLHLLSLKTNEKIAKSSQYPTFSFFGGFGTNFSNLISQSLKNYSTQLNNNFRQNFGVNVSVPIFNGNNAKINYQKAKLNTKSASYSIDQSKLQLKQDIYLAYTNASSAYQRYLANEKTVSTAQLVYDYSKKRFDVNLLSPFELITNKNNLNKAINDKIIAQYEYVFRMKVLEYYKGLGIKL